MSGTRTAGGVEPEVCESYTWARRLEVLIGRVRSPVRGDEGWTLPGGPYTVPQLVAFVGTLLVLVATRGIWAPDSRVVQAVVLLGIPAAATLSIRYVHVDGRPLVGAIRGGLRYLVTAVVAPWTRRVAELAERPPRRPGRSRQRITVITTRPPVDRTPRRPEVRARPLPTVADVIAATRR